MASDIAVPLDLCLKHIYDANGETNLSVDIAIKLLKSIVDSPADQKLRNVNAKLLTRVAADNKLQLWYVLRHAGFAKDGDRLICALSTPITTTSSVLQQLIDLSTFNAKVREGVASKSAINTNAITPTQKAPSTPAQSSQSLTPNDSMNDSNDSIPTITQGTTNSTSPPQTYTDSTPLPTTPTSPSPTGSTPIQQGTPKGDHVLGGTKANVANMTAEERKAYVQALMAAKRAAKQ